MSFPIVLLEKRGFKEISNYRREFESLKYLIKKRRVLLCSLSKIKLPE